MTPTKQTNKSSINLDYTILKKAVMTLRAINHPLRRQMMEYIKAEGQITVTELFIKLRLEQSVVSQHLAILRKVGVLQTNREGKYIFYSLNEPRINEISTLIQDLA
jgi:ArsR family transcriptional regulator, virulence genes transcriptional regulator